MQLTTVQKNTNMIDFIAQRNFREKVIAHTEVLDRAKKIMLIPKMDCLTTSMVADYFDVDGL